MTKNNAKTLLNHTEQDWLVDSICQAEKHSTGEIRVHLENATNLTVFDRASDVFAHLNMHETRFRNGVLIYVAVYQQEFSIIGDLAINKVVKEEFWDEMKTLLSSFFRANQFFEGLSKVIKLIGLELKKHFPVGDDANPDELTNEISFG